MKKSKINLILMLLLLISQCDKNPSSSKISVDLQTISSQIIDITNSEGNWIFLDSSGQVYKSTGNGNEVLLFDDSWKSFYQIKTGTKLTKKFDWDSYVYPCNAGDGYYACYYDFGWSSCIDKLAYDTYEVTFFSYFFGIPSGLYAYDGELWYLCNKNGDPDSSSRLNCYNMETAALLFSKDIYANLKGLFIQNCRFYVFDTNKGCVMSFTIEGETISELTPVEME